MFSMNSNIDRSRRNRTNLFDFFLPRSERGAALDISILFFQCEVVN